MRRVFRIPALLGVSLSMAAVLAVTVGFFPPGHKNRWRKAFQRGWARTVCRIMGIRIEVVGVPPRAGTWLAVSNHLGYADIPVLGSILPATFVSKSEVARWPLVGSLANLAGTIYVDRDDRGGAGAFVSRLKGRLSDEENLLVFPEGTSSRGDDILPFRTVPFAAAAGVPGVSVLPLHIEVVEIEGKPTADDRRDLVCWHGDASFAPHAFRLAGIGGVRFRVVVGNPIPCEGLDRKELAAVAHESVVDLGRASARLPFAYPGDFHWVRAVL